ncbi:MAG TPA: hypothetical protein VM427_10240 [Patescibacteria group bacterium]|nr:hypothetical protein [Patescibacteria group bacterium]
MQHPARAHSFRAHSVLAGLAALGASVILVAAACDAGPSSTDQPVAVGGRVVAEGFVLEVRLPSQTFATTDAIPVRTTLTWTGAPGGGRIWGSGSGPVSFTFNELGGAGRTMGGAMTADCGMKEFPAGVPTEITVAKSGGWTGEDPNAAFYQAWYKDPALHLPAGRWQMRVSVGGFLAPCEMGARTIEASVGPIDLLVR